ncbi:MAG: hypothetical protein HQL76_16845 [Magnetococcales bacterium]|nr:hypothetical protein [Magnetococcales bacterium]
MGCTIDLIRCLQGKMRSFFKYLRNIFLPGTHEPSDCERYNILAGVSVGIFTFISILSFGLSTKYYYSLYHLYGIDFTEISIPMHLLAYRSAMLFRFKDLSSLFIMFIITIIYSLFVVEYYCNKNGRTSIQIFGVTMIIPLAFFTFALGSSQYENMARTRFFSEIYDRNSYLRRLNVTLKEDSNDPTLIRLKNGCYFEIISTGQYIYALLDPTIDNGIENLNELDENIMKEIEDECNSHNGNKKLKCKEKNVEEREQFKRSLLLKDDSIPLDDTIETFQRITTISQFPLDLFKEVSKRPQGESLPDQCKNKEKDPASPNKTPKDKKNAVQETRPPSPTPGTLPRSREPQANQPPCSTK